MLFHLQRKKPRITMPQTPRVPPSAGQLVQVKGHGASLPQDPGGGVGDDEPEPC